ncbi:PQQ-binding-like beta-propeller repeat protein [Streptomyces sp. NPDC094468]|uniref:protein kinase domain-containing protein n=1 Tax=Streptomyces sp. NPDC094468 TaxID=3366066 RepID=UPI0038046CDB
MTPQRNTGADAEAELPEYAGHYRLESCLGSGGMGVVHLARSTSGLKLAVKVVHAEFAKDREFRGRFRQEVAAARKVSGAFTAPVVDADPEAARPWMATLFIPGPTLSEQVKRNGPMSPAQLRRLMAGLAEALRDIHRVGVVHRDLKPSNVLLAKDGPKVIDFGISRPKDSELRTETGKLIGTPPFMAPEQFRRPREVGPAADIFALGSVLVHAATGRGPFDSDSPYVVAYQVVHDEPDLTGMPEELAPLVLRCLAKEPEDRPTPDEMMRELRSLSASYDTQAFIPAQRVTEDEDEPSEREEEKPREPDEPPAARSGRGPRPARKVSVRRMAVAAGAGLLVLGGVLASVPWSGDDGPAPTGETVRGSATAFEAWQREAVAGNGSGMPQCVGGAGRLLCLRSGLAFALDPTSGRVLWRHRVADERTSGAPSLSGGLLLVAADGGRRVTALDPATGSPRWQRELPAHQAMTVTRSMLLVVGADRVITGIDAGTGRTRWSLSVPGTVTPSLSSFAGDRLAYATSTSDDGTHTLVTALDPEAGEQRWEARLAGDLEPVGGSGGSLFLLSTDLASGQTDAVVRYTPAPGTTRRVALPVRRDAPGASVRGDVVYLLAAGGSLEAVDMDGGRRLWGLQTSVSRGSAPVADGRHVYFTAADGRLLAVDARKGTLVGQTPARLAGNSDQVVAALSAPLVVGAQVYAGAPDGSVFAVDGADPAGW